MAESLSRERSLLRFAEDSEDAAAGLHQFRESLPRHASRITAIVSELFAISAVLRQIRSEEGTRRDGPAFYRINEGLALLFRSLKITLAHIFDMFARSGERPEQMVWEDLNHWMEREEGYELLERLEWYRDFLDAQFNIIEGRRAESPLDLRHDLEDLLEAQESSQRRFREIGPSGRSTPRPPILSRPPLARMDPFDDRPPVPAPEPPPSPTFTSSSSRTMSSSQTSYSSDPSFLPGPSPSLVHWAQTVFNGSNPNTLYKREIQSFTPSKCYGPFEPTALQYLLRDGFCPTVQLTFDEERLLVRLYWRPHDHRARILITVNDDYGQPLHYCTPLTNLRIIRDGSSLQLCRARRGDGSHLLWARLNFLFHERMVLFYSTFVAMKRQDDNRSVPDDLIEHLELQNERDGEKVLFAGQIKHANMYHALRLFRDRASGVVRLEASALRGSKKDVPIWTAFVTRSSYDPDWAQFEGRGIVSFAALKPSPFIFISTFELRKNSHGHYMVQFTTDEDAQMFMENWAGLCQRYGRNV